MSLRLARVLFLFICLGTLASAQAKIKLIWRQTFQSQGLSADSALVKPSAIDKSFVVKGAIEDDRYVFFDETGRVRTAIPSSQGAVWHVSPTHAVAAVEESIPTPNAGSSEDVPSTITAFTGRTQIWQRTIDSTTTTFISDSGISTDLDYATATVKFYDTEGHLVRDILPFGVRLPWSLERPAFGAWSADGSRFALLATNSLNPEEQVARLFIYDSSGTQQSAKDIVPLKIALGVGVSPEGNAIVVVGETGNSALEDGTTIWAFLVDAVGTTLDTIRIPAIGEQVVISPIPWTKDFIIDTRFGTIIRMSPSLGTSSFEMGPAARLSATAANANMTAITTLEPSRLGGESTNVHLRIVDGHGALLVDSVLESNITKIKEPMVWLTQDGQFVAVRFAHQIRYYNMGQ